MPRASETQRTVRTAVDTQAGTRPRIEEQRRFFSGQGNTSGIRTAKALQEAFGVGTSAYMDKLDRENEAGAKAALSEAGAGGARSVENENIAYQRTWDKLDDQRSLQRAASELPSFLLKNGAERKTEQERQELINGYMEQQHAGLDDESERRGYGRDRTYLSEGLLKLEATEMMKYRDMDVEKIRDRNNSESMIAMRTEYEQAGEIDYGLWAERTAEFNEGGDKAVVYWEGLWDLARDTGDMSILDNVPEKFANGDPTHKNTPEFSKQMDAARSATQSTFEAKKKALEDKYLATYRAERAMLHASDKAMAREGDPQVLQNVFEGVRPGPHGEPARYTEAQATTLVDSYLQNIAEQGINQAYGGDFAAGNLTGGTQDNYDRGHAAYIASLDRAIGESADVTPEQKTEALLQRSIERSVVNGRIPTVLKDQLNVNVRNPAKFAQAAELYQRFEAQLPGFVESQINDKQARNLSLYNRLMDDYGTPQAAIAALEAYDSDRSRKPEINDSIPEAVAFAAAHIADKEWTLFNYPVTDQLTTRVEKEIRHYVNAGYDLEEAEVYAIEAIKRRTVRAGDHLYPIDAGWGDSPEDELEWALQNEAAHRGPNFERENLRVVPHPSRRDEVLIQDMSAVLPGVGISMRISEIREGYRRYTGEVTDYGLEMAKLGTPEMLKIAENQAFAKMFPTNPYGESGERSFMIQRQRRQWELLNPQVRDMLIRQQLVD